MAHARAKKLQSGQKDDSDNQLLEALKSNSKLFVHALENDVAFTVAIRLTINMGGIRRRHIEISGESI